MITSQKARKARDDEDDIELIRTSREDSSNAVYLDCNATTPIEPEVHRAILRYMTVEFGNSGSRTHDYGARAKKAVEHAREQVALVVKAKREEVIFTSGA